ncbi:MAG: hypothetical protein AUJ49_06255 [Desulfovibrionaceae bacterium CG1_02_65_16]|nr:MAG: hypothetical protein AUJ49_06255 [Desulfovibrionaceae bacterium CG1_02_65_16]
MLAEHASTRGNRNISEEECPFTGGKVCLFGSGPRAVRTRDWLRDRGVEVAAYLDNDVWRQDELLDGVPILAPNKAGGQGGLPVIVCCAVQHKIGIGQQLAMLGVEDVYFLEDAEQDRRPPLAGSMQWDRLEIFCADLADEDSRLALAGVARALELGRGGYVRMSPYLQAPRGQGAPRRRGVQRRRFRRRDGLGHDPRHGVRLHGALL